jgi:transcriptional regulator with XRE-family HTH domain
MTTRAGVSEMIQKALKEGTFSLRDVAESIGGSYGTVREWSRGARTPTAENVGRLADAFDRRADLLRELAGRMRGAATSDMGRQGGRDGDS